MSFSFLLSMMRSRSIYVAANGIISLFLCLSNIPLCICITSLSNHLSMDIWVVSIVLAVVNSAAMNIGLHVSFQVSVFSRYMPRSGIIGSYGNSIFSSFKEFPYCSPEWLHQFRFSPTV